MDGETVSSEEERVLAAEDEYVTAEVSRDRAFVSFQESANLLAQAEMRIDRSRLLQDWAQVHLKHGQPEDLERARELSREALAEFEDMGSPGYIERVRVRLDEIDG